MGSGTKFLASKWWKSKRLMNHISFSGLELVTRMIKWSAFWKTLRCATSLGQMVPPGHTCNPGVKWHRDVEQPAPRGVPCLASLLPLSTAEGEGSGQTNPRNHPEESMTICLPEPDHPLLTTVVWTAGLLAPEVSESSLKYELHYRACLNDQMS